MMPRAHVPAFVAALIAALVAAIGLSAPASAVPGGEIDTLTIGKYTCELPGDALGPRGEHVADADFAVLFGSRYTTQDGGGTYLLTGDQVIVTSGPKKGERYHRLSQGFLRKQKADGTDSDLRCVIANRSNSYAF